MMSPILTTASRSEPVLALFLCSFSRTILLLSLTVHVAVRRQSKRQHRGTLLQLLQQPAVSVDRLQVEGMGWASTAGNSTISCSTTNSNLSHGNNSIRSCIRIRISNPNSSKVNSCISNQRRQRCLLPIPIKKRFPLQKSRRCNKNF